MDLPEAEDIKMRWQEYTEYLYKNYIHDPDNHDGVITQLEPNILECEVVGLRKQGPLGTKRVMEYQYSFFKS